MYNEILADLQYLLDECDKISQSFKATKVQEQSSEITLKEQSSEVQELFDLFKQIEKELFSSKDPSEESRGQFPYKLANISEKRTLDILTGVRTSTVYQGPIFPIEAIHQPKPVPFTFKGETHIFNPDFQIGNMVIEVKCYGAFIGGFPKNKKQLRGRGKCSEENTAKFQEISKTQPFQVWIFDNDQGDLIDIITYVDGQPYHSNGHPLCLFSAPIFLKQWILTSTPLGSSKTLRDYFLEHATASSLST